MPKFDDETLAKLQEKLIAAGYTDGEWRSIMLEHYNEDYEHMAEFAKRRAEEREKRRLAMDISKETSFLSSHGASRTDPALTGNVQALLENTFQDYFTTPPVSDQDRKLPFELAPPSQPISHTIGTTAPGKGGVASSGPVRIKAIMEEEEEKEGVAEEKPSEEAQAEGEEEGGETKKKAPEPIDEDELMFIWNRREAPQHRRPKVDQALEQKLQDVQKIEETMNVRRNEIIEQDKAFWATIGVSDEHPDGTIASGQFSQFLAKTEKKPTALVMDGQHQTARWALEVAEEAEQPDFRSAILPIGPPKVEHDESILKENFLISTRADLETMEQSMLRESLGPSKLEMPPDADPHYMNTTFFKTAHSMNAASKSPRPDEGTMKTVGMQTTQALQEMAKETEQRIQEVQRRLKKTIIKDAGEKLDIPAILLRKFNYLKNPRYKDPPVDFRGLVDSIQQGTIKEETKKGEETFSLVGPAVFVPKPQVVQFTEYEVDKTYELPLKLQNVTGILRRIRIMPPASEHFSVSLVKYLGEDGLVAPGMYCMVHIRFNPDTLADYEDTLHVVTEKGLIAIPLLARRLPPNLTLPDVIDIGNCFVDDMKRVVIPCRNQGGKGQFILVPDSEWPQPPDDVKNREVVSMPPFRFSPSSWELNGGEELDITVEFCPARNGKFSVGFRLVCDNCSVQQYQLVGTAITPSFQLVQLDSLLVVPPLSEMLRPRVDLSFPNLAPGAYQEKLVTLQNRTPLEMDFRWEVDHTPTPHTNLNSYVSKWGKVGQSHQVFSILPISGTFAPNQTLSFQIQFAPVDCAAYEGVARLLVPNLPCPREEGEGEGDFGASGYRYKEYEMSRVQLKGTGHECEVAIDPLVLVVAQKLSVGKVYCRPVTVRNLSDAPVSISWEKYPDLLYQTVRVLPDKLVLAPREEKKLKVEIAPKVVAPLQVSLACNVEHGSSQIFTVIAETDGPRVRITSTHLDFGLMRVGWRAKKKISFLNICDVSARWSVSLYRAGTSDPWGPTMTVSPSHGILDAGKTATVEVEFRPEEPERMRSTLVVEVEGGQTEFLSLRGEVVFSKVCLDTSVLDLGTIFLAVPVTRRITMRNLTLLPSTPFRWDMRTIEALRDPSTASFKLQFRVVEGILGPEEEQQVDMTIEAISLGEATEEQSALEEQGEQLGSVSNPGILNSLVPLHVEGMPELTGFELRARVMGLAVTYHLGTIESIEPVPDALRGTPAALKVGVRKDWPRELVGVESSVPIVLDFGERKMMEKHSMTFVVRNHTGIEAAFNLHAEEFGVPEHEMEMIARADAGEEARPTRDLLRGFSSASSTSDRLRRGGEQTTKIRFADTTMGKESQPLTQTRASERTSTSLKPSSAPRSRKHTGTIASIRMGATMQRAVSTGPAGRSLTQAEIAMRKNRVSAPYVKDAERQLDAGLRRGHASIQLLQSSKVKEENTRLRSTALWCLPGDHSSIASRGRSHTGQQASKLILSDDHEEVERFRSMHGQKLLNQRSAAQEAFRMLEGGKGFAVTCSTYTGRIEPWGEVEVRVDLFSDVCGIFRDRLVVEVIGLPVVHIPVLGKLVGSPVGMEGGSLGLNLLGEVPSVDFGDILINGQSQTRSLRVRNSSPWPLLVDWQLLESAPPNEKNLIQLSSVVGEDGTVSYQLAAVEPPEAKSTPFTLTPHRMAIPAHSTKTVDVSCQWHKPQHHDNFLVGSVSFLSKDMEGSLAEVEEEGAELLLEELRDRETASVADLQERATGMELVDVEQLVLALRCEVTNARLEADCHKHLKWICSSSNDWRSHASYVKELVLSNRGRCNQTFALKTNSPFSIDSTVCTAPVHPMARAGDIDPASSKPQLFILPPKDNLVVRVRFTPPSKHRSGRVVDDQVLFGELVMLFSNEEVQRIELEAQIKHPQLDILPEELNFNTLHVESTAVLTLALCNPTYADAHFKIVHAPKLLTMTSALHAEGSSSNFKALTARTVETTVDDAEVFSFEPQSGVIRGNLLRPTIPESVILTVRFNPKKNVDYRSRFKVEIEGGRGGYFTLLGSGSYDESKEPGGATGIIRDHPGFHPLMTGVRGPIVPGEQERGARPLAPPPPMSLPSWYNMDQSMQPQHLTKHTLR
ncbi:hypothetical protein GUITHDRAFT_143127 [Guillardia theta CCMP2712]|uniref:HYDIN/VesB/CFA65-like Ig-like domain-containing protein n=3 Tax=Guillardia theta TaxID=55529 RepID=L1IVP8_GUITC|nr:hypothetical protein GUITHDRAFT_143127 [Guillardia theta CCMP2712]EKX39969.1 hypothetical protein GUITHDRAFT_143127 [Guillardia theta CCMP2712]|eukprot:XP_005826949.1 hypothetical protein GUITHDRAFT_143127 [Guillardia theta CCMP2712]